MPTNPSNRIEAQFFAAITDGASDMIVLLDGAGRRLYANPAFVRVFGSEAARHGADSFSNIHPDDRLRVQDIFAQVLATGQGTRAEYRIIDRGGKVRYLESQSNVIEAAGQPRHIVVVSREVTERRLAQEALTEYNRDLEAQVAARTAQLSQANAELERTLRELQTALAELRAREEDARRTLDKERELNEMKLRFVSMTSHEFRTPLTMIHSAAQLLCDYDGRLNDAERAEILADIRAAVSRMTLMLDEVLTISRADAGKLEFQPQPLAVVGFCRQLLAEIDKSSLQSHRLRLEAPERDDRRGFDEKLLRLILTNLLTNAIKYSDKGSEVCLRVGLAEGETRFEVVDQGIGIPDGERNRMFETFYRASNVGQIAGTGLGLAIVRRAVQRHGGQISCASREGRGTHFTVVIPHVTGE